jgi:hypothetical protein
MASYSDYDVRSPMEGIMTVLSVVTTVGRFTVTRDLERSRYPYAVANREGLIVDVFATRDEAIRDATDREERCSRRTARRAAGTKAGQAPLRMADSTRTGPNPGRS